MAILLIVLVPAAMAVVAGGVVLVLVAAMGRADADPEGRRGEGVYLGAVAFVAIYMAVFATFGMVTSLASLLSPRPSPSDAFSSSSSSINFSAPAEAAGASPASSLGTPSSSPVFRQVSPANNLFASVSGPSRADEATTGALASGLVALGAFGVLAFHRRRLQQALAEEGSGLMARVMDTYRRLVSFVGVFIVALSGAVALFGVYRLIAPGMSGSSGRSGGLEELIDAGYLALASAWVVMRHRPSGSRATPVHPEP